MEVTGAFYMLPWPRKKISAISTAAIPFLNSGCSRLIPHREVKEKYDAENQN
jgi:hypothetical protein